MKDLKRKCEIKLMPRRGTSCSQEEGLVPPLPPLRGGLPAHGRLRVGHGIKNTSHFYEIFV